jgi:hypothetical protein
MDTRVDVGCRRSLFAEGEAVGGGRGRVGLKVS